MEEDRMVAAQLEVGEVRRVVFRASRACQLDARRAGMGRRRKFTGGGPDGGGGGGGGCPPGGLPG